MAGFHAQKTYEQMQQQTLHKSSAQNNFGNATKDLTQIQYPKTLHKSSTQQTYDKCKNDITQIKYPENQWKQMQQQTSHKSSA